MSVVCEKRAGQDRRLASGRPPSGIGERRANERRQTIISDIPFIEWATHFAAYKREISSTNLESSRELPSATTKDGGVE